MLTGRRKNLDPLLSRAGFTFVEHDLIQPLPRDWDVQAVFNLASPASPVGYLAHPIETALVNSHGTLHMLELAERHHARFLQASTSEVYGDPLEHPQRESYWGNVNPHGIRSCYDEGKRFAEALTMDFHRARKVDARLIRIFNTYGPRSQPDDGRVVPNFVCRALKNETIPIYGEGSKTRSYCYVDDLVRGIMQVQFSDGTNGQVYNLGNPAEFTLDELAALVLRITKSSSRIEYLPPREDDPTRRKPDISHVQGTLGWEPRVALEEGLLKTIGWFRDELGIGSGN